MRNVVSGAFAYGTAPNDVKTRDKAALIIVGDEVLSGSISDANTPWLGKFLQGKGVDLVKVEVRDLSSFIK